MDFTKPRNNSILLNSVLRHKNYKPTLANSSSHVTLPTIDAKRDHLSSTFDDKKLESQAYLDSVITQIKKENRSLSKSPRSRRAFAIYGPITNTLSRKKLSQHTEIDSSRLDRLQR